MQSVFCFIFLNNSYLYGMIQPERNERRSEAMNDIIKAMEERRSIRKFKPEMPSKDDLNQIIDAGLYAASGIGRQATITVAVTNKELRDKLSALNRKIGGWPEDFDPFYGAPAILIVLAEKDWRTGEIGRAHV